MEPAPMLDVLVAGAGLPGLATAAALARKGLAVAICDRAPIAGGPRASTASDDDWDRRVYAVSPGSATFLAGIGAWQHLACERTAAVEAMDVAGDGGGRLTFSAYAMGARALAWVVEERALRAALVTAVHAAGVQTVAPVTFADVDFSLEQATLHCTDGTLLSARLLVAADGQNSWVRNAAGIVAAPTPYADTAVVANFACEHEHRGVARQWFLGADGVLAWLPLPGKRVSMVWSAPATLAATLLALPAEQLAARVAQAGGGALGAFVVITAPAAFPLAFLRLPSVVAARLVMVGDAAHGVHPLAGQGVNLGFGDAAVLADVLGQRGPVADVGSPLLLERHARRRAEPVLAMQAVTDGLARLFSVDRPWLGWLRNGGMATIERFPGLKRALAKPALR